MERDIVLLVIQDRNGMISWAGEPAWDIPEATEYLKRITFGHHVIAGERTAKFLNFFRGSQMVVVSNKDNPFYKNARSFEEAVEKCGDDPEIFIAGGARIYAAALPRANVIYSFEISGKLDGFPRKTPVYFPSINIEEWPMGRSSKSFTWQEKKRGGIPVNCREVIYQKRV